MAKYSSKQDEANKEATNHQQFDVPSSRHTHTHIYIFKHTYIISHRRRLRLEEKEQEKGNFWELLLTHL